MHFPKNIFSRPAYLRGAGFLLSAGILALALYVLAHTFKGLSRDAIESAMRGMPAAKIWACGLFTGASFLALGGYDVIAVRVVAYGKVSVSRAWFAGAVANAFSNTLGFRALMALAIRYRLLARSGLTSAEVAGITALSWSVLAVGFASVFSLGMMASPDAALWQRIAGLALLAVLLAAALRLGGGKRIAIRGHTLFLPSTKVALAQIMLGMVEMGAAICALYILMPQAAVTSFPAFCALYIGAVLLGMASHVPGGLGVFEATLLTLTAAQDRAGVLAALLLYRIIYNLCPFALAITAFTAEEIRVAISLKAGRRG